MSLRVSTLVCLFALGSGLAALPAAASPGKAGAQPVTAETTPAGVDVPKLYEQHCAACHATSAWKPATRVDHAQVTGSCSSCHNGTTASGPSTGASPRPPDLLEPNLTTVSALCGSVWFCSQPLRKW